MFSLYFVVRVGLSDKFKKLRLDILPKKCVHQPSGDYHALSQKSSNFMGLSRELIASKKPDERGKLLFVLVSAA